MWGVRNCWDFYSLISLIGKESAVNHTYRWDLFAFERRHDQLMCNKSADCRCNNNTGKGRCNLLRRERGRVQAVVSTVRRTVCHTPKPVTRGHCGVDHTAKGTWRSL